MNAMEKRMFIYFLQKPSLSSNIVLVYVRSCFEELLASRDLVIRFNFLAHPTFLFTFKWFPLGLKFYL